MELTPGANTSENKIGKFLVLFAFMGEMLVGALAHYVPEHNAWLVALTAVVNGVVMLGGVLGYQIPRVDLKKHAMTLAAGKLMIMNSSNTDINGDLQTGPTSGTPN